MSALDHIDRKTTLAGFFIALVHVEAGLPHGFNA
jgi:hypothetical protein